MLRIIGLCIGFILLLGEVKSYAQTDSIPVAEPQQTDTAVVKPRYYAPPPAAAQLLDSVVNALKYREKYVGDSLSMQFIKRPDSLRHSLFVDSLLKEYKYNGTQFLQQDANGHKGLLKEGSARRTRDPWVVVVIIALLVYTGMLNRTMSKDVRNVVQSFYNNRVLSQVSKEENLLNSWAFIGLFLLFGLTFGLFIYQVTSYYEVYYRISGVQLFVSFSLLIIVLFAVKLLILRFLGWIFDMNRLVSEYISILYLTYFNITFVFLPVSLCFSLLAARYIPGILLLALILVVVIFVWQYLRSSVNIISSFRFHKFYLFLYLCALEICPILILIKALNS